MSDNVINTEQSEQPQQGFDFDVEIDSLHQYVQSRKLSKPDLLALLAAATGLTIEGYVSTKEEKTSVLIAMVSLIQRALDELDSDNTSKDQILH